MAVDHDSDFHTSISTSHAMTHSSSVCDEIRGRRGAHVRSHGVNHDQYDEEPGFVIPMPYLYLPVLYLFVFFYACSSRSDSSIYEPTEVTPLFAAFPPTAYAARTDLRYLDFWMVPQPRSWLGLVLFARRRRCLSASTTYFSLHVV